MKRNVRTLGLFALALSLPVMAAAQAGGLRYSITVSKFENKAGDSLHVGHLMGQLMLRRFQLAGHHPIALAGGATYFLIDTTPPGAPLAARRPQLPAR